ncbi:MAG: hypothetical protein RLZZ600_1158 [Actinomycetota bacterium]|jgi:hypothetical protein
MDTIVFGLILACALIIIFKPVRWLVVTSWAVASLAATALFLHHVTSVLPLSF